MIDVAVKGTLNTKMPKVAYELFEKMAMNSYQWQNFKAKPNKPVHVHYIDAITTLTIQVEALSKKINGLSIIKPST